MAVFRGARAAPAGCEGYLPGMPHVLITGATGFVGSAVTRRFLSEGWSVAALSRDAGAARARLPAGGPAPSILTLADLSAPVPDRSSFAFDAVVHLAGASIAGGPWTRSRRDLLWRSRVDGTHALIRALGALPAPPPVFVSASGMGYYGDRGDEWVSIEDAPGDDFLGRMAAAWEEAARGAETFDARTAHVRLGMVLGRGGGALAPLRLSTRLGLGAVLGDGCQYCPWIHRDDAAALFYGIVTDEHVRGAVHGVSGEPVTQGVFARTLATVLLRPVPWRVPAFALRAALGELSDLFLHGQRAMPDARFALRYPMLEAALREACDA